MKGLQCPDSQLGCDFLLFALRDLLCSVSVHAAWRIAERSAPHAVTMNRPDLWPYRRHHRTRDQRDFIESQFEK
jgi:hypothetical protein